MFCGPQTANVSQGKADGDIGGRGYTKHNASRRSQSLSILF